ncbi:uncharacterized protein LOC111383817 [Olea europaea var. sylvestris]|uniref:Uncharacterized protein n=1 Tax=Olea europaea subsp. europaea TaxID=158383 RepID=A0A8S0Q3R1_OLEEU|nr:uncharacterized protein LOC111383817 [Olea europaea var. sylvestris]CAA2960613.1 Hypothetical predicted protein [Olea europaea subsp. europaea]
MEFFSKFQCFVLFLFFLTRGSLQCYPGTLKDITITQVRTGAKMMNKPEWKVTVQQKCHCSFTNVKVRCPGFDSVVKPSPFIISKSGPDLCLLDYGNSIGTFHFTYGSDQPIAFVPYSFVENCS